MRKLESTVYVNVSVEPFGNAKAGGSLQLTLYANEFTESINPKKKELRIFTLPLSGSYSLDPTVQIPYNTAKMLKSDTYTNSTFGMSQKVSPPPLQQPVRQGSDLVFSNQVRCDNWTILNKFTAANGDPGCINPAIIPQVIFSKSNEKVKEVAANIENGQATFSGIGSSESNPLHRVTPDEKTANRNIACSPSRKAALLPAGPPPGMVNPSCDEYPFASTLEGGSSTVIAYVPGAENSSQGGSLGDFFNKNRVIGYPRARDAFVVTVTS